VAEISAPLQHCLFVNYRYWLTVQNVEGGCLFADYPGLSSHRPGLYWYGVSFYDSPGATLIYNLHLQIVDKNIETLTVKNLNV
jgi:hypothetical protein